MSLRAPLAPEAIKRTSIVERAIFHLTNLDPVERLPGESRFDYLLARGFELGVKALVIAALLIVALLLVGIVIAAVN